MKISMTCGEMMNNMLENIKALPEQVRKKVVLLISITILALVVLAFIGAEMMRPPTPEIIIAPGPSYNSQV